MAKNIVMKKENISSFGNTEIENLWDDFMYLRKQKTVKNAFENCSNEFKKHMGFSIDKDLVVFSDTSKEEWIKQWIQLKAFLMANSNLP